jgi:putative DNA primase/helicase
VTASSVPRPGTFGVPSELPKVARSLARLKLSGVDVFPTVAGERWKARCPCHPDGPYTLAVTIGKRGRAAIRCWEGCSLAEITLIASLDPDDVEEGPPEISELPPEFSDDALALEFTKRHRDEFRFTAKWGKWHRWDGATWQEDSTFAVIDCIRSVLRGVAADAEKPVVKNAVTSARAVRAVELLARADRAHAATPEQWDADKWLLNTPGGVVNLRTGSIRNGRTTDYMTRVTAAAPATGRPSRWMDFLERVTGGDADLQAFLQRLAGYCLTGSTQSHAMFFLYGTGGNGKGTFVNTLRHLLGSYAKVAPIDTFTESKWDRHPTELAMLHGARLVSSQETEEGRRWAEAKIKTLTGGDPISARFMKQDFFEFSPQFKLVIAGNHRPHLINVDEAIRRRFHLVPFTQTIPPAERIEGLDEQLRAEFDRILGWAIAGCGEWLERGLCPPHAVLDATAEYFEAEDSFQSWLDEMCELNPGYQATFAELFESWRACAERARERVGSAKEFSATLTKRGFQRITIGHSKAKGFSGLRLSARQVTPGAWYAE